MYSFLMIPSSVLTAAVVAVSRRVGHNILPFFTTGDKLKSTGDELKNVNMDELVKKTGSENKTAIAGSGRGNRKHRQGRRCVRCCRLHLHFSDSRRTGISEREPQRRSCTRPAAVADDDAKAILCWHSPAEGASRPGCYLYHLWWSASSCAKRQGGGAEFGEKMILTSLVK
ncbi:MAG: hypothetical protein LUI85_10850 [Bacteroides sp.]|nr:hypothetical protein [Bacteroides sp.]